MGPATATEVGNLAGKSGQIVDLAAGQSWCLFGHDTISGVEDITCTLGNDWIKGDDGANTIVGGLNTSGSGGDRFANIGDDVIFGMGGNDTILAGNLDTGNNWIEGGAGADVFGFNTMDPTQVAGQMF